MWNEIENELFKITINCFITAKRPKHCTNEKYIWEKYTYNVTPRHRPGHIKEKQPTRNLIPSRQTINSKEQVFYLTIFFEKYTVQVHESNQGVQVQFSSLVSEFSEAAFNALLLFWIWLTYSTTMAWNFGASLLVEDIFRPAFFKARVAYLSAFSRWGAQRQGTMDLKTGFPQSMGPVGELQTNNRQRLLRCEIPSS